MTVETLFRDFTLKAGGFAKSYGDRWEAMAKKVAAGTYDSAQFLTDVKGMTAAALDVWFGLWTALMGLQKILPHGSIETGANDFTGKSTLIKLNEEVPSGKDPKLSDLSMLSDPTKKLVSGQHVRVGFEGGRDTLRVTLTTTSADPPLAGLYSGLILVDDRVVAVMLVNL
jgi:hypothetical protein